MPGGTSPYFQIVQKEKQKMSVESSVDLHRPSFLESGSGFNVRGVARCEYQYGMQTVTTTCILYLLNWLGIHYS